MQRAFVVAGTWEKPESTPHDTRGHQSATLRASALIATGLLASVLIPQLEVRPEVMRPIAMASAAPEIVKPLPKEAYRLPSPLFDDVTGTTTLRRAMPPPDTLVVSMRSSLSPAEAVRETEVLEPHTLRHAGRVLRLAGISAPKPDEVCRRLDGLVVSCLDRAMSYLNLLVKGRALACDIVTREDEAPTRAVCRAGEADLSEAMVRQGWARADAEPEERILMAESAARRQKLGIWR